jgi:hypothetical protein
MVQESAARSTLQVVQAGRDLRDALGDPEELARAADRLASTAESTIAELDRADAAPGIALVPEDAEDLLAATLSQLGVAGTMFAASEAVGEHGPAAPGALDDSLRRLDETVSLLARPQTPAAQGISAPTVARSGTVAEALAALERQLARTVEDIVGRSTKVIDGSLTGIHDRGPDAVRKAWDLVNSKLHLDQLGGKLASIGLRAFRSALEMLARIVPAAWLAALRERIDQLIAGVDKQGPARTVVGLAIGASAPALPAGLDQSTLDTAKLDRGTGDLVELGAKYGKLMDLCGGIGTAVGLAAKLTVALRLAIPQLGVIILSAHVLVVGTVLVLGRDHIDAGIDSGTTPEPGHGLVRGVRTIVAEATA